MGAAVLDERAERVEESEKDLLADGHDRIGCNRDQQEE